MVILLQSSKIRIRENKYPFVLPDSVTGLYLVTCGLASDYL